MFRDIFNVKFPLGGTCSFFVSFFPGRDERFMLRWFCTCHRSSDLKYPLRGAISMDGAREGLAGVPAPPRKNTKHPLKKCIK